MAIRKPVVALVGRPNVGKSTLFNRLIGERRAVVDEVPGTTRDRLVAEGEWSGRVFDVVDTGGIDPSHMGAPGATPLSIGSADFIPQIRAQAEMAIRDAEVVLFITDGQSGVSPADIEIADILRRHQHKQGDRLEPPVILVVNKCESATVRQNVFAFYELGMGEPQAVSGLHGTGVGDLLDVLVEALPAVAEAQADTRIRLAILGKPNVGKSSLLNRLLGEERVIVSPIPGTTRDAIDTQFEFGGVPLTLIDTAGIRRRGKIERGVEQYSVLRTLKAVESADVALLMLDATQGVTAQDAHIAGYILEARRSTVLLVNKWDRVEKDSQTMEIYTAQVRQALNFMDYVPVLFISALTGQRVDQVLPLALRVQEERLVRIQTAELNRIVREALEHHAPPAHAGRKLKFFFASQVRADPPTFLFHVNEPALVHFSYRRYIENQLRERYGFLGTPIQLSFRARR